MRINSAPIQIASMLDCTLQRAPAGLSFKFHGLRRMELDREKKSFRRKP
jgi:hypothetical protein